MSNFSYLKTDWPDLSATAFEAEQNVASAPGSTPLTLRLSHRALILRAAQSATMNTRCSLEIAVKWLYANDSYLKKPYSDNLAGFDFSPMAKPFTKISKSDTRFI